MSQAVADAGPIIHLAEIGHISLLNIFETVYIPDAVWKETVGKERVTNRTFEQIHNIQQRTASASDVLRYSQDNVLEGLHAGELESLYLCQEIGVYTILTDDLAVRDAAKGLGIRPVGSLGVIVRAYQMGMIELSIAEALLHDLYLESSLYVTRAIVDLAIEQVRLLSTS